MLSTNAIMKNKLIIFDFDGVLVNTEYTTFNFYKHLLPEYNIYLKEEDFKYKIGRKSVDFFKDVLGEKFNQKLVDELITIKRDAFIKDIKKYLIPLEGVFELLQQCDKTGLLMAVGSQNEEPLIQKAMDVFDMRKYFKVITSLQDIENKKPNPEVFLLVTNTLGIAPVDSVVIEDAPVGIQAAKKGGFKSIAITTSFARPDLADADLTIDSLTETNSDLLENFGRSL